MDNGYSLKRGAQCFNQIDGHQKDQFGIIALINLENVNIQIMHNVMDKEKVPQFFIGIKKRGIFKL